MDKPGQTGYTPDRDWPSISGTAILNAGLQVLFVFVLMVGRVAAAKSAGELGAIQAILRLQELIRNVAYILGPTLLIIGFAYYLFSRRSSNRAVRGKKLIYGGTILFGISLALSMILNLIAWIVP